MQQVFTGVLARVTCMTHGVGQDPVVIFGHLAGWKLPSR